MSVSQLDVRDTEKDVHRREDIVDARLGGMVVYLDRRLGATKLEKRQQRYLSEVLSKKDSDCQPCGKRRWSLFLQILALTLERSRSLTV